MKLLVADKFSERHLGAFQSLGLSVAYRPELGAADLPEALAGVHVLVVRSTEVRAKAIEAADALTLIVRAGAGVNTIDRAAAAARGIFVANCPGKNAIAVAELAFGLLLSLDRRIPDQVRELRAGKWNKKEFGQADGLYGRTLGLLGLGAIGREVARRAQAFGLHVLAWSRSLDDAAARALDVERAGSPLDVARRSDAVSVHVALTQGTTGLCDARFFDAMRPGAVFLNTARAEVVDGEALARAVAEKGIRAGLDVHAGEPDTGTGALSSPLLELAGVYGTHHVGASTRQAEAAIADEAVRIVKTFALRGEVPNCVNLARRSPARWQLVVRHLDRVGVLANVLGSLRRHHLNVEEMDNQIFEGATAACCTIRLVDEPPAECLEEIRSRSDEVLHAALIPLPVQE
jgi:D-3-phosphoglycerate dehydrogenase / 2-oxoglutarate reductase